jgi:hypothetical protein
MAYRPRRPYIRSTGLTGQRRALQPQRHRRQQRVLRLRPGPGSRRPARQPRHRDPQRRHELPDDQGGAAVGLHDLRPRGRPNALPSAARKPHGVGSTWRPSSTTAGSQSSATVAATSIDFPMPPGPRTKTTAGPTPRPRRACSRRRSSRRPTTASPPSAASLLPRSDPLRCMVATVMATPDLWNERSMCRAGHVKCSTDARGKRCSLASTAPVRRASRHRRSSRVHQDRHLSPAGHDR